jgi:adenylate cyclase
VTESPRRPTPDDLERLLLGASRKYTREDVAEAVGISVDKARMYWRALGFPDTGGAVAFTIWDAEALKGVLELVESGRIDEATAVQMVRALGRMTGRLAEWHVETLATIVEAANEDEGSPGRLATAYQLGEQLLPEFERLLIYTWRRKLAASAGRMVAIGDVGNETVLSAPMTVGFADLVSFTRLSRGLTVEALARLVESFEATSNDVIAEHGGRVVKTLGDEVIFVAQSAEEAATIACQLVIDIGENPKLPDIRVGLATGPVVTRLGDVFGEATNLAARLTALANRNVVLTDTNTAKELSASSAFAVRALPPTEVRGIGVVAPYEVLRRPAVGSPS